MSDPASLQETILSRPTLLAYWPQDAPNLGAELLAGRGLTASGGLVFGTATGAGDAMTASDYDGSNDRAQLTAPWASRRTACTNPEAGVNVLTGYTSISLVTMETAGTGGAVALPTLTGLPSGVVTGAHCLADASLDAITLPSFNVLNGEVWTVSVYSYLVTLGGAARIELHQGGGSATATITGAGATDRQTIPGAWLRLSLGYTFTSNGTCVPRIRQINPGAAEWFPTAVMYERTSAANVPGTYFNGAPGGDARWAGTAHLSESVKGPFPNGATTSYAWWANRDTSGSRDVLLGGSTAGNPSPAISLESGSNDVQWHAQAGGSSSTFTGAWPGNGSWNSGMLVVTPGTNVKLLVNGAVVATNAFTDLFDGLTPGDVVIGDYKNTTTDPADAKLAHYAIYAGDASAYAVQDWGWGISTAASRAPNFGLPSATNFPSANNTPTGDNTALTSR